MQSKGYVPEELSELHQLMNLLKAGRTKKDSSLLHGHSEASIPTYSIALKQHYAKVLQSEKKVGQLNKMGLKRNSRDNIVHFMSDSCNTKLSKMISLKT